MPKENVSGGMGRADLKLRLSQASRVYIHVTKTSCTAQWKQEYPLRHPFYTY